MVGSDDYGNIVSHGETASRELVAEDLELSQPRPDEREAGIGAGLRERDTLAQEPVAGMDRVTAAFARRQGKLLCVEIRAGAPAFVIGSSPSRGQKL